MTEPLSIEPELFQVYAAYLEEQMKCQLISVSALFVATIILIILCCWEETRKNRPVRVAMKPEADSKPVSTPLCERRLKFHPWLRWARLLPWVCPGLLAWSFKAPVAYCSELLEHRVPLGLDEFIPVPEDNPRTPEKIELGRQLFFDKRLSRDETISCASCHNPEHGFATGKRVAVGIDGRQGRRNAPTILNRAYGKSYFWDGRAKALEDQPLEAITNPNEMDLTLPELEKRLHEMNALPELNPVDEAQSYCASFEEVFGEKPSAQNAANAIAT